MPKPSQKPRRFRWKPVRVTAQIIAVAVFIAHFFALAYPYKAPWPADAPFKLDPLEHIYLLLSGHGVPYWGWALAAIVLLFAVSRIFCGWACPLGTLFDFTTWLRGKLSARLPGPARRSILPPNFDLYLLLTLLVLAVLRVPLLWLLDPIVFSFKFLTIAVLPVIDTPLRAGFETLDNWFYQSAWWYPVQDGYNALFSIYHRPTYTDTALFLAFAAALIGLEFWQPRFWCRYLCPLGALNRLTYRLHPLRRRLNPDCAFCLSCEKACHFGGTAESDCLYCMECIDSCAPRKLTFLPQRGSAPVLKAPVKSAAAQQVEHARAELAAAAATPPADTRLAQQGRLSGALPADGISRRLMLKYTALGLAAYPALRLLDNHAELPADFLRPPGVLQAGETPEAAEQRFTEICIKCGQCLKACLTNGLQPSLFEAGLSALWTPRLIPRLGECEYNCNLCGQACPTGAIPRLTLEEKQQAKIGVAYVDKNRCIPWDINSNCTVCEEHCPVSDKAIKLDGRVRTDENGESFELNRPYVIPELCTGCGICERVCPVPGLAAIRVLRRPPGSAYGGDSQSTDDASNTGVAVYGEYPSSGGV
jgi:MauM/NapG family ferredoxin protein